MALRNSPEITAVFARADRIRNVRARVAVLKDRVRDLHQDQLDALQPPGVVWRGWWYPRWLVLALTWGVAAIVGIALVVGIFRLFAS